MTKIICDRLHGGRQRFFAASEGKCFRGISIRDGEKEHVC